eukprot:scaffold3046_cov71-Cyclotella_meneghiniana.AAC.5
MLATAIFVAILHQNQMPLSVCPQWQMRQRQAGGLNFNRPMRRRKDLGWCSETQWEEKFLKKGGREHNNHGG